MRASRLILLAVATASCLCTSSPAQTPPAPPAVFAVGQAVEVREGDRWSHATIKAREGRRVQIAYDDGTEEWVTPDRIRAAGSAGPAPATAPNPTTPNAPAPATRPAAPTQQVWQPGSAVEIKWGGTWSKAHIQQRRGDWYLVAYDGWSTGEWVEPWRIRKVGDESYDIDPATPNPSVRNGQRSNPPQPKPDPLPEQRFSSRRAARGGASEGAAGNADARSPAASNLPFPVTEVDRSAMEKIAAPAGRATVPWDYRPAAAAPITLSEKPVPMRPSQSPNQIGVNVGLTVTGPTALLVHAAGDDGSDPIAEIVNLTTSQITSRSTVPDETASLAPTPDGQRVVGLNRVARTDSSSRVDLWTMPAADAPASARMTHLVSFRPYSDESDAWQSLVAAYAIDNDHVVTVNRWGRVVGFAVGPNSVKATWSLDAHGSVRGGESVAFSPERKTLALCGVDGVLLADTSNGKIVGKLETGPTQFSQLSFRGDGKRLLAVSDATLAVFDLEKGQQALAMPLSKVFTEPPAPPPNRNGPRGAAAAAASAPDDAIRWLAGDVVWFGGTGVALDVETRAIVGIYRLPMPRTTATVGDRLIAIFKPQQANRVMASWKLPDDATPKRPPIGLPTLATPPGTEVALDITGLEGNEETKASVGSALRKQIAAMGWVENPSAALRIIGKSENGRSEQRTYQTQGGSPFNREQTSVTVTEKITRLSIEKDGKTYWQVQNSSMAGFLLQRAEGQSVQDAADAQSQNSAGFLRAVTLPNVLFEPMETLPVGLPTYELMPAGVRPVQ